MGDRGQQWRRDVHENSRRVRVAMMVRWLGSALDMVDMLQGGRPRRARNRTALGGGGCLLVSRACVPEIDARAGVACSDQCMLLLKRLSRHGTERLAGLGPGDALTASAGRGEQ